MLAFLISWGAIGVLIALNGMPTTTEEANAQLPMAIMAFLLGPCICLSFLIGQLPPFRIMMVFAYERTGSLLLMMIMHFSLTACSITFAPTAMAGWQVFIYSLAVAALFWLVALVFIRAVPVQQPE